MIKAKIYCSQCGRLFEDECQERHYLSDGMCVVQGLCPECQVKTREQWRKKSGLGAKFLSCRFKNSDNKNPSIFKKILNYANCATSNEFDGKSLVLWSDGYGTGKTHFAANIINYIIDNWPVGYLGNLRESTPVLFTTGAGILGDIRASYDDREKENEDKTIKRLTSVPVLVLDDIGKYQVENQNFMQRIYFSIIDGRYSSKLPIIVTSNLSPNKMVSHIGEACVDRLSEVAEFIQLSGQSYRQKGKDEALLSR